ncbi:MAG: division plane positioning ATPase MipZ [Pseudomonadota bacterium]
MTEPSPHVIVLGNEKGGSGKSTTAMHLFVALARQGHKVGAVDLDSRQQTFFRYLDNRAAHAERIGQPLLLPQLAAVEPSTAPMRAKAAIEDRDNLREAIRHLGWTCTFIIIDTPGAVTPLSEAAHAAADTLITPMNDSLIDFDLLGRLDPSSGKVAGPSVYSELVWSARQYRAAEGRPPIDWLVLRNRLSTLDSRNKRRVGGALAELSRRIGFRVIPGFSERVIFRELFLNGLTLLDLKQDGPIPLTLSHVAARQELRDMVRALDLPGVQSG